MIIDVHTHIGKFGAETSRTPEDLLKSMDNAGIETSLVIASSVSDEVQGLSTKQAVEVGEQYPRLKIIGNVEYPRISIEHIQELIELLKTKKIVGVKMYTGYEHFYPNDSKLYELYRFCSDNGFPVIFHTGFLLAGSKGLLKYSHPLHIDELAQEFPDLKILIAHFGYPWIEDCGAVVAGNKNVYADLSAYFTEFNPISKKEQKEFTEDIGRLVSITGGFEKFLFGTDWPIYSQKEYVEAVKSLPMSKEERELVFWKNAKSLFGV
ncbi:MAG: amidohydrolase [Candidatus Wildermuthbacteria bacterium]|nr:amidohydrolase [Candidatus Wildermuthbacteria bacterium]